MEMKEYLEEQARLCVKNDGIGRELYEKYNVKKGLRDENGKGVLTGLTNISRITAFRTENGQKIPCDGELLYRGYDIREMVEKEQDQKLLYEEGAYLLLFGELPDEAKLREFREILASGMTLPTNFTRDVIMKAPSADIMNSMTRSVLTLASYDERADDLSVENVLRQSLMLISVFPMLAVYGYHAHNYFDNNGSMYIHRPDEKLSISENILRMLRPDTSFTELEARVLDVALLLHMEHGGGNNSTFTERVVTSAGTDTYAATAAALSSLKGKKHGGANLMVRKMILDIKANVRDTSDPEEVESYLRKILNQEAFDRKGLIYGMGHAVYSLSDPREIALKRYVERLALDKGRERDMALYSSIETIAPKIIADERKIYKGVSPNVDFYSGFVYDMLDIPEELYTPLFATARIVGWSAHRIEELVTTDKIIRPAYMSLADKRRFAPREER